MRAILRQHVDKNTAYEKKYIVDFTCIIYCNGAGVVTLVH